MTSIDDYGQVMEIKCVQLVEIMVRNKFTVFGVMKYQGRYFPLDTNCVLGHYFIHP